jgi:hypothetical protein
MNARSIDSATIGMVEAVIRELQLDPQQSRLDTDKDAVGWGLMKGSAEVFIFINPGQRGDTASYIEIVSPVMWLPPSPERQLSLFRRLLSHNANDLTGVAFGVKAETVVLTAGRSTTDLDPSEVKDLILRVGYYADAYDDALVAEFGGRRHSD